VCRFLAIGTNTEHVGPWRGEFKKVQFDQTERDLRHHDCSVGNGQPDDGPQQRRFKNDAGPRINFGGGVATLGGGVHWRKGSQAAVLPPLTRMI
jgi:hypothetical protein